MKRLIKYGVTFILFVALIGCSTASDLTDKNCTFNARIITTNFQFQEEFLLNNKTFGAYLDGEYINDENYSKEKIIIIKNQEKLEEVFKEFDDIDFTEEIALLHGFTTASNGEYELKNIKLIEKKLTIDYANKKKNELTPPNASIPDTKWLIVRMNIVDVDSVEFNFVA